MVRFSAQEEDVDQGGRGKEGQEVGESLELQVRHNHGKMRALASRANMSNDESWGSGSDRTDSDASLTSSSSSSARPSLALQEARLGQLYTKGLQLIQQGRLSDACDVFKSALADPALNRDVTRDPR